MTFQEVRFPDDIALGARGGPGFLTIINEKTSGKEQRNIKWQDSRARYNIAYGIKTRTEMDTAVAFFMAMRGRAYGFRFKDHRDYQITDQTIGQTDGSTTDFQIFKRYSTAVNSYDRTITKIVSGTYSVEVNNVPISEGAGASQYQIDVNTGIITLGSTHAATSGQNVDVTCEFDVPVRFDVDDLYDVGVLYKDIHEWTNIPLVETRDIS